MPIRTVGVAPIRKVTASGAAGALSTVLVFVVNTYIAPGKPITPAVAAAIATILAFAAGYLRPQPRATGRLPLPRA